MEIDLVRLWKSVKAITGMFSVDGEQKYFSIELPELFEGQPNIPFKTCILPGSYPVQRLWSDRWGTMMPHIVDVPGRTEIEIHVANFPRDLLGCIGIGMKRISETEIGESEMAFEDFMTDFDNAISADELVRITIS